MEKVDPIGEIVPSAPPVPAAVVPPTTAFDFPIGTPSSFFLNSPSTPVLVAPVSFSVKEREDENHGDKKEGTGVPGDGTSAEDEGTSPVEYLSNDHPDHNTQPLPRVSQRISWILYILVIVVGLSLLALRRDVLWEEEEVVVGVEMETITSGWIFGPWRCGDHDGSGQEPNLIRIDFGSTSPDACVGACEEEPECDHLTLYRWDDYSAVHCWLYRPSLTINNNEEMNIPTPVLIDPTYVPTEFPSTNRPIELSSGYAYCFHNLSYATLRAEAAAVNGEEVVGEGAESVTTTTTQTPSTNTIVETTTPTLCICTREYRPVCCEGKNYSNRCMARCRGCEEGAITFGNCATTTASATTS